MRFILAGGIIVRRADFGCADGTDCLSNGNQGNFDIVDNPTAEFDSESSSLNRSSARMTRTPLRIFRLE